MLHNLFQQFASNRKMNQNVAVVKATQNELTENDFNFIHLIPSVINIAFLLIGTCQMYLGIEINHPIYCTLFLNLIVTLFSSIIDILIFPFVSVAEVKYSAMVNGNGVVCLLFHCCSWSISSVLRYIYIIHPNWLHKKFQEARTLCLLATLSILAIFSLSFGTILGTVMYCGWPYKRRNEMSSKEKAICTSSILTIYLSLVGSSCIFYVMILRKRGKLGINHVGNIEESSNINIDENEVRGELSFIRFIDAQCGVRNSFK